MRYHPAAVVLLLAIAVSLTACPQTTTVCPAIGCPPGYVQNPDCQCVASNCETTVATSSPFYDRFEATSLRNRCDTDRDCVVGGCSSEMCAAESGISTCEGLPEGPEGNCGCYRGQCQWITCAP